MAKKQTISKEKLEIKKAVDSDQLTIGTESTLKALRAGSLEKVFLAENCSEETAEQVMSLCSLSEIEVVRLPYPNTELGAVCKKPFSIAVLGLLKVSAK